MLPSRQGPTSAWTAEMLCLACATAAAALALWTSGRPTAAGSALAMLAALLIAAGVRGARSEADDRNSGRFHDSYLGVEVTALRRGSRDDTVLTMTYRRRCELLLDPAGLPVAAAIDGPGGARIAVPLGAAAVRRRLQAGEVLPGYRGSFSVDSSSLSARSRADGRAG